MNTVISIENVSKSYQLGAINTGTFLGDLQRRWARMRGLPDPHLKIGEVDHGNRQDETLWALKNINFQVKEGEALGIIGSNGAGKSTLLKIISRVTAPTGGEVKVKGRIASLLEVGTGFHPDLTGRENIYLNGAIMGMNKTEISHKFDKIVDFADIEKFIDTPVKRYSSGMYVRLAFAIAAHMDPEILIVDEVLAVGDVEFQKKCLGKMDEVSKGGRTVIFVSHNMGTIRSLCNRCILLVNGQIVMEDRTDSVVSKYLSSWNAIGKTKGEIIWTENGQAPGCNEIRLRSIRLLGPDEKAQDTFEDDKPIWVELTYHVYKSLRGVRIILYLTTEDGVIAFASNDQNQLGKTIQPGLYRSQVTIPGGLLNRKRYFVSLYSDIPGIMMLIPEQTYLGFTCVMGASRGSFLSPNWEGALAPNLEWSFEKLD